MARYEHLPIFREAYDLSVHIEKIVRNFSRYHKYTLGTDLRNKSLRILEKLSMPITPEREEVSCWNYDRNWRALRCWPGFATTQAVLQAHAAICMWPSVSPV